MRHPRLRRLACPPLLLSLLALPAAAAPAAAPDAARLWDRHCSSCHGDAGNGPEVPLPGVRYPDFTDPRWQERQTEATIKNTITNGLPSSRMRGFKEKLSPAEIDALVSFVRGLRRK